MRELRIHLDGADPAIAEHRISLEHLGRFTLQLFAAYRRVAQQLLTGNREATGRVPERARELQLDLAAFTEGCVNLVVRPRDTSEEAAFLFGEPIENAALLELATGIANARDGSAKVNPSIRRMLRSLPKGVRQRYDVLKDGQVETSVEFATEEIEAGPREVSRPELRHLVGQVVGVVLEPTPFIHFRTSERTYRLRCTMGHVELAWQSRQEKSIATAIVLDADVRLVALRNADGFEKWMTAARDVSVEDVASRWMGVLEKLAAYDREG